MGSQPGQYAAPPSFAPPSQYAAQPPFETQGAQPNNQAWAGRKGQQRTELAAGQQPGDQQLLTASFNPQYPQQQNQQLGEPRGNPQTVGSYPQDNLQNSYGQPPVNNAGARRAQPAYGTPAPGAYTNNPYATSRSQQIAGSFSDDPVWLQAERFESPEVGDLDSAIRLYESVGRDFGQKDPNLALRAMNRAQYLRNQISAGVAPQGPLTRSAKPTAYGDTAATNVYANSYGQQNLVSQRRPPTTAETNVYGQPSPAGQFLLNETQVGRQRAPQVEDLTQPRASLPKPVVTVETKKKTEADTVRCPGRLEPTDMYDKGRRFYRMIPDDPKVGKYIYCAGKPGVNLADAVNRHVEITGPFYEHADLKQYYMEVSQVNFLQ